VTRFFELNFHDLICQSVVGGDFQIVFMDHDASSSDVKMFSVWMNTAFIKDNLLVLEKDACDGAVKDKEHLIFPEDFKVEFHFRPAEPNTKVPEGVEPQEPDEEEFDDDEDM